ncbi:phosphoserine phosphatase [Methanocella sp. CWC-04]|uniref:phosphoserine phosphatase n=2 Tax=Methanooceanicella nereidis TaxID=2052831 RepID=A0AAP2RFT0_9EURY|nr:phosphoserine phosphatase [Methanocella sp. CWC-04]
MSGNEKDLLPSWNEGQVKRAMIDFVSRVTKKGGPYFVPAEDRIATFDNDGTLWIEKPFYVQLFFAIDRIRSLAQQHPEWREKQPYKAILENDKAALANISKKEIAEMLLEVHAGSGQEEFIRIAREWLANARHPRFNTLFTELVYQPMLELIDYLRANGFKVFIVSGGGIDFIRAFSEETYGIPCENVVGSSLEYEYAKIDGDWRLTRLAKLNKYDDAEGKPESIALHIGRRPIFVGGNSDGDLAMMRYAATGKKPFLNVLLHHDDAHREWSYDVESPVGKLSEGLDEAEERGWTVVSMKNDWDKVFQLKFNKI